MPIPISDGDKYQTKNQTKESRLTFALKKWFNRMLHRAPRSRDELIQQLRTSKQHDLLDAQALKMLEGVLQISDRQVRDIMVPRAKMTLVTDTMALSKLLPLVIESGHSRFPVMNSNNEELLGLLLAKDLLKYNPLVDQKTFNIRDIIRPAVFIPESKRLDSLLKEFQHKHYHMAIVVDEYGAVSGLITIEDVLEEIVGEIEDEHDDNEEIFVQKQTEQQFLVKALMPIEDFNDYFLSHFTTEQFDTIGGFIANQFGYLPKRGAHITVASLHFRVLRADNRQIRLLQVTTTHKK